MIAIELVESRVGWTEIHRFSHRPIDLPSGLHWDITGLWREIVAGLTRAGQWARNAEVQIRSVGVDAWGVDWGLLNQSGELVGLPHAYRDQRNVDACRTALELVSSDELYRITGIQLMHINSVFSLFAQQRDGPELIDAASQVVFVPDLFHFWLSGARAIEATIASTSQLIDLATGDWATAIIERLSLPARIFGPMSATGSILGNVRPDLADACGLPRTVQVVLPASHDTASAVAAVPAEPGSRWCFLSSGTWSLLGAELTKPCVSRAAQQAMFTNERGVGNSIRFLKNIAGLWLVQQVREDLSTRGQELSYEQLTAAAAAAKPFQSVFDVDRPEFQRPGDILNKIDAVCRQTHQAQLRTAGEYVRSCLESLAHGLSKDVIQAGKRSRLHV